MLAEVSTKDISQAVDPQTFEENQQVAQQVGNVAKVVLQELESKTGNKVVSELSAKKIIMESRKKLK